MLTPNPVIEAIDAGHYVKVVQGEGPICRATGDPFPCEEILAARRRLRERAAHRAISEAARKARQR